jgi:hypothetical protein
MRFETFIPQRANYPFEKALVGNNINGPFDKGYLIGQAGVPGSYSSLVGNNGIIGGSAMKEVEFCNPGPHAAGRNNSIILGAKPGVVNFANNTPVFLRRSTCTNHLSKGLNQTAGSIGDGATADVGHFPSGATRRSSGMRVCVSVRC